MQKGGVVDRQLVKGSSLPSDEQRTLLGYASRHPESTLHSTGRRHDAAVLLIHGIGTRISVRPWTTSASRWRTA